MIINATGCGFHPHSRKGNIYLNLEQNVFTQGSLCVHCCGIQHEAVLFLNQLYAISRMQQGKQRHPSVKTLRSRLCADFFEAFHVDWQNSTPKFEMKIFLNNNTFRGPSGDRIHYHRVTVTPSLPLVPLRHDDSVFYFFFCKKILIHMRYYQILKMNSFVSYSYVDCKSVILLRGS